MSKEERRRSQVHYKAVPDSVDIEYTEGGNTKEDESQKTSKDPGDSQGQTETETPVTAGGEQDQGSAEQITQGESESELARTDTKGKRKDRKILKELVRNSDAEGLRSKILSMRESYTDAARVKQQIDTPVHTYALPLLHFAIQAKAWGCLTVLCETGQADVNVTDSEGRSALHHIAEAGVNTSENSVKGANYLIEKGAIVDACTNRECTPLHYAAEKGNTKLVKILLDNGVDKAATDAFGNNVLHHSVRGGYVHMVVYLLKDDGVIPCMYQGNGEGHTPLHYAVWHNRREMLIALMKNIPDTEQRQREVNKVDKYGKTALMLAVKRHGNPIIIDDLLAEGADIDIQSPDGTTVLHLAATAAKQYSTILITYAVNKSKYRDFLDLHFHQDTTTPLHAAARTDNVDAIRKMMPDEESELRLKVLNYVDKKGDVPFLTAVRSGAEEAAIALLELGSHVFVTSKKGETALHIAILGKQWDLVKMFLLRRRQEAFLSSIGIVSSEDISKSTEGEEHNWREDALKMSYLRFIGNIGDNNGYTPLHHTVSISSQQCTKMLLDLGSKLRVQLRSNSWRSPYLFAVERGDIGIAKLLFEAMEQQGFYPLHDADNHNNTAAHLAAERDHLDILEFLLDKGEDLLLVRNNENQSPLQVAVSHGSLNCIPYLVERTPPETSEIALSLEEAVSRGYIKTVAYLLETQPQDKIKNPVKLMNIALKRGNREMVQTIVQSKYCKEALTETSTYSRMIQTMPNEARLAMDRCIREKNGLVVDFSIFLSNDEGNLRIRAKNLSEVAVHPVMLIVDSANQDLICHPTFLSYISELWKSTRGIYWFWLISVFVFALIVSANVAVRMTRATIRPLPTSGTPVVTIDENNTSPFHCDWLDPPQKTFVAVTSIFIILAACVGFIMELLQVVVSRWVYFSRIDNWFDLAMYAFCLPVVLDLQGCYRPTDWQWDLGPFAVLLTWFNVLFFMKGVPVCGLYICMVSDILTSFLRFLIVFVLFVVAFALSFSILLHDLPPFQSVYHAFPSMWVMATGELGYTDLFHPRELGQESPLGRRAAAGFCMLLIFVSMMTIILANLMTGLAVEDVSRLRQQAKIQMVKIRAELVMEMKYLHLPVILVKALFRKTLRNRKPPQSSVTYTIPDQFESSGQHLCIKIVDWKDDLMDRDYIIKRALEIVRGDAKDGTLESIDKGVQNHKGSSADISDPEASQMETLKELVAVIQDRLPREDGDNDGTLENLKKEVQKQRETLEELRINVSQMQNLIRERLPLKVTEERKASASDREVVTK